MLPRCRRGGGERGCERGIDSPGKGERVSEEVSAERQSRPRPLSASTESSLLPRIRKTVDSTGL